MAKGFGFEYFNVLSTIIKAEKAKGIYISDLRLLTEYHIDISQVDIRFAASMFTPLTEMFLVGQKIEHEFSRNREGAYVSGVSYNKPEIRELVDTLSIGFRTSSEKEREARRLYDVVFKKPTTLPGPGTA